MKNILVTGAGGFIGRSLSLALKKIGHNILELTDGDLVNPTSLDWIDQYPVDFVYHLAAKTFVPDSWGIPADFQSTNVMGTVNVLELCRKKAIPITYVSAYLYGNPKELPVTENCPIDPNNPYALSKSIAETVCKFYADHYAVPVTIIRPFNIYGPGQKSNFLIPEIIAQVHGKKSIRLKDLEPRRDYLYVDDLVDALVLCLKNIYGNHIYNIGSGDSLSVAEIVDIIQSVAGTSLPLVSEGIKRKNEILNVRADITRAKSELGWYPKYTFKQGINKIFLSMEI